MDRWAYERGVELDFSRPGKRTDNAKIESFNGRLRQAYLNLYWFLSLDDVNEKIEAWRQYYNETHPYSALQWESPAHLARQALQKASSEAKLESEILLNAVTNLGTGSIPNKIQYQNISRSNPRINSHP